MGTTPAFASAPLSNALSSNRNLHFAHFSASAEAQSTPMSHGHGLFTPPLSSIAWP